jgi:cell division protein FtsB
VKTQDATRPRRRQPRTKRTIKWGRFGAFLVIVWAVVTLAGVEGRIFKMNSTIAELERQIEIEQQRAALLDAEIAYRDTDDFIELVARRELGLVKTGEMPVLVGVSR